MRKPAPDDAALHRIVIPPEHPPDEELTFRASRAGGPGGQHVNKASTRVEARWDVGRSASLTEAERDRLRVKLRNRISADGILRVVADEERSQARNKAVAAARLRELVSRALREPKPRKRTHPPRAVKERRLAEKKHRGEVKRGRRPPTVED